MTTELFQTEKKPITHEDRIRLGAELAKVDLELKKKKEEKTAVSTAYRVTIRKLEEQSHTLCRQLDSGMVEHKFPVEEVPDDARMFMDVIRTDTNQLVNSRPMNEAEREAARRRRQGELFESDEDTDEPDEDRPKPRRSAVAPAPKAEPKRKRNGKGRPGAAR